MSAFSDILGGRDDELYGDPTEPPNPRVTFDAPEPFQRAAVQKVAPEVEGPSVGGFISNAAKDVGRFAGGIGALMGEVALHPVDTAEAVGRAVAHPLDTAKMMADPIIERYTPQDGEGIGHMLARTAYEHPFDTLLDASTVIQGPFGAAAKVADVAGAANVAGKLRAIAEAGKAIDPITLAQRTGRTLLRTQAPDTYALSRTMRANTDALTEEVQRKRFLENDFATRAIDAANDIQADGSHGPLALTPAEHAIKFAYAEGRVPIIKDDMITEITHRGALESRKVGDGSAIRPEALDAWMNQYKSLQGEFEQAAGLAPEQYAEKARASAIREAMYNPPDASGVRTLNLDFNPFTPEAHDAGEAAYQQGLAEATERQQRRTAVTTMTALDVAKEQDFRRRAAQFGIDEAHFNEMQKASGMPHPWEAPTLEEALDIMGPNGGVIIPHSMEVMNR